MLGFNSENVFKLLNYREIQLHWFIFEITLIRSPMISECWNANFGAFILYI